MTAGRLAPIAFLASVILAACTSGRASPAAQPAIGPTVPTTAERPRPQAPTSTPTSAPCTNDALFIEDLSLPDGTPVAAGADLEKRWSVVNQGTCDWNEGYRLVHVDGDGLLGPDAVAVFPARAGSTAVWEVVLQAPADPGEYRSVWQAQAPDGTFFGDVVYVSVLVEQLSATDSAGTPHP